MPKTSNQDKPQVSTPDKLESIVAWLQEKQAAGTLALDLTQLNSVTEAVLITSAANQRHAQALADWILQKLGEQGWEFLGLEGYQQGTWILMDLNDLVLHIFQQDYREFYNLEGLWHEADVLWREAQEQPRDPEQDKGVL
ncbi:MAG: ribosome silencing factor [Desulfohalobiaceae bacterium]